MSKRFPICNIVAQPAVQQEYRFAVRLPGCTDKFRNGFRWDCKAEGAVDLLYREQGFSLRLLWQRYSHSENTEAVCDPPRQAWKDGKKCFTLIGNRMKGRRACWSEKGVNNLVMLLCQRHTVGFENLFAELPAAPNCSSKSADPPVYSSSRISKREGKDYEWRVCFAYIRCSKLDSWLFDRVN